MIDPLSVIDFLTPGLKRYEDDYGVKLEFIVEDGAVYFGADGKILEDRDGRATLMATRREIENNTYKYTWRDRVRIACWAAQDVMHRD